MAYTQEQGTSSIAYAQEQGASSMAYAQEQETSSMVYQALPVYSPKPIKPRGPGKQRLGLMETFDVSTI